MSVIDATLRDDHAPYMLTYDEIFAELVRQLDTKRGTAAKIARILGLPATRIAEIKKGERRIQPNELAPVAEFLGLGGVDPAELESNLVWVPVIGIATAGSWREAIEMPAFLSPQLKIPHCNQAFAVQVDGDSMNLILPERSYAVIDPDQKRLINERVYLIQNGDGETTIKRYRSDPARFEPVSDNPLHNVIHIGEHEITVLGRVVSFTSSVGL